MPKEIVGNVRVVGEPPRFGKRLREKLGVDLVEADERYQAMKEMRERNESLLPLDVTPEQQKQLREMAEEAKMSLDEFCKKTLLDALEIKEQPIWFGLTLKVSQGQRMKLAERAKEAGTSTGEFCKKTLFGKLGIK